MKNVSRKNIGKSVAVIDRENAMWCGWWGIVKDIDSDGYYHVAMANDSNCVVMFARNELRVSRS